MGISGLIFAMIVILSIVVGFLVGLYVYKIISQKKLDRAHKNAKDILSDAKKQIKTTNKEIILEAKEKSNQYRAKIERELKKRRSDIQHQENRLLKREEALDKKDNSFEKWDDLLSKKEANLKNQKEQLSKRQQSAEELINKRQAEVERVASLSQADAKQLIIDQMKKKLSNERAKMIKDSYETTQKTVKQNAKELIVRAIQQSSADIVSETTVSVVNLPNDDMKGRIIGREGRNIRTFETLTGIDLVIDDTPEAVVLSGFNPIRREIAKMALEKLIKDGRIHPARIEEMINKSREELSQHIQEVGENTIFDLGIHSMNPELIKLIGNLKFKSYRGQNVLAHSVEVAKLAGALASELGEDINLSKRAGLLHAIGLAVNEDVEGSHVNIGVNLAKKYKEGPVILDSIRAYHDDYQPKYIVSELVAVANKISMSRPGARSKSFESFVHRLSSLEKISNSFEQVKKSYAIEAGREIRVIVKSDKISDTQSIVLAHDIKNKIEHEMEYPGHIKVTIIREVRSIKYAK
ncbi:ribonuclease Y [Philodulcilactobacillus myokoensis]|uniref:Ribonuclease Y n=1 Tax=Philodulcilactobacillus myokoensis TaxID=2929573 RepID=A0A9W6EST0_9LACO|nr:ribonuclease Y [Philodulcilactobacillus myokoensis]GLB46673.1 ribonuclease Y [Philodulcilactobacillus myokoensis]